MPRPPRHRPAPRSQLRIVGGRDHQPGRRGPARSATSLSPAVLLGALALFGATLVALNLFGGSAPAPVDAVDWQPAPTDWRAEAGIVDPPAEDARIGSDVGIASNSFAGDDSADDFGAADDGVSVSRGGDSGRDARGADAGRGATGDRLSARFGLCHSGGGRNCVVDGDTFWFGGEKFRIADIDTPETHPPRCAAEAERGAAATRALHGLLNRGPFSIERQGSDRYGRTLAIITRDGESLGGDLVGSGLARWYGGGRQSWC